MKNIKTLVLYHKEDADGLCSAAIIYCYLFGLNFDETKYLCRDGVIENWFDGLLNVENNINGGVNNLPNGDEADFKGVSYADLTTMVNEAGGAVQFVSSLKKKYDRVFMTDISFNEVDVMCLLYKEYGNNILWFDHHKAVIESSKKFGFSGMCGCRSTITSAIMLVYHYFYGMGEADRRAKADRRALEDTIKSSNYLFRALGGFDSWNPSGHQMNDLNECLCYTRGFEFATKMELENAVRFVSYCIYDDILNEDDDIKDERTKSGLERWASYIACELGFMYDKFKTDGSCVVETQKQMWKRAVSDFGDFSFNVNGESTVVLYMQQTATSLMFDFLKGTGTEHVVIFKRCKNNNWAISMYNVFDSSTFNVGSYLKEKYNGGGHFGAGGATLSSDQFDTIMLTHSI